MRWAQQRSQRNDKKESMFTMMVMVDSGAVLAAAVQGGAASSGFYVSDCSHSWSWRMEQNTHQVGQKPRRCNVTCSLAARWRCGSNPQTTASLLSGTAREGRRCGRTVRDEGSCYVCVSECQPCRRQSRGTRVGLGAGSACSVCSARNNLRSSFALLSVVPFVAELLALATAGNGPCSPTRET